MRTVSQTFADLYNAGANAEVRLGIAGTTYSAGEIYDVTLSAASMPDSEPGVGNAVAAKLEFSLEPKSTIPRMAQITAEVRFRDGETVSEWLTLGTFFIDTRETSADGGFMQITAYDAMLKTEQVYKDLTAFTTWPQTDTAIVGEICTLIGVTLDPRTSLAGYNIGYPNDYTMREILRYVAAGNGGNWIITPENKLRLVPFKATGTAVNVGLDVVDVTDNGAVENVSRVTLYYGDESAFTAGSDTGRAVEYDMPWATQAMTDTLLTKLSGAAYHGYTASAAALSPAVELGDPVTVNGVTSPLTGYTVQLAGCYYPDITSSGELEVDSEYRYESKTERQMRRAVKLGESYYGTRITRENGLVIEATDGTDVEASVTLNADELAFRSNENGVMRDKLYFDPVTGQYVFDGKITVRDGSIEFIDGASFTQVRYSTDPQAAVPGGWSTAWDPDWDDGSTRVWAIYSYNGGTDWGDPVMIQGADGDTGDPPITVSLYSTAGTIIAQGVTSTRIYAIVMQGSTDITLQISYLRFSWHKFFKDGTEDLGWIPTYTYEGRRDSINITETDIASTATFTCLIEEES